MAAIITASTSASNEYHTALAAGGRDRRLTVRVAARPDCIAVGTDAYDGVHQYPYPNPAGKTLAEKGYDELATVALERDRLQALADAGRPLWEE